MFFQNFHFRGKDAVNNNNNDPKNYNVQLILYCTPVLLITSISDAITLW